MKGIVEFIVNRQLFAPGFTWIIIPARLDLFQLPANIVKTGKKAVHACLVNQVPLEVFTDDSLGERMECFHSHRFSIIKLAGDEVIHLPIVTQEKYRFAFEAPPPGARWPC